jgi:cyclic beta-1,2-glucan synthetase
MPAGDERLATAHTAAIATHLLSNGRYAVMLTAAGSGYSRWRGLAVTRWRKDPTCDDWGSYVFLRDVRNGDVWSAGFQPSGTEPDSYDVTFSEDRAEITRHDGTLTTSLEVLVSAEDDAEVRRVSIANSGNRVREIDVTSYSELVLAPQADDVAHPAFMKLFVATEYLAGQGTLLATRRRRSPAEQEIWAAHLAIVDGEAVRNPEVETDRARFLGRGHDIRSPIAVTDGRPLSNTVGTVLDPIFALRRRVRVAPGPPYASPSGQELPYPARQCSTSPTSIAMPPHLNGWPHWRGLRRRCNCIILASIRAKRTCSSAPPDSC